MFFFSSRRRHTRCSRDWSSDVCSSDLSRRLVERLFSAKKAGRVRRKSWSAERMIDMLRKRSNYSMPGRSEEHTSELQSRLHLVCRLLLEKTKTTRAARDRHRASPTPHTRSSPL